MQTGLLWFRRDLRLHDNAALHLALASNDRVCCCFCFDREILDELEDRRDRRVEFIHQSLTEMEQALRARGSRLIVRHGTGTQEIPKLAAELVEGSRAALQALTCSASYRYASVSRLPG